MKSKIYSSRYMKISLKGMIWIPAFITIGFLLAFPVTQLIMLGNWMGMEYTTEQISLLYENLWRDELMHTGLVVSGLAALFNGVSQFWYLYSSRKIDFYHSLPMKRSRMFWYKTLQSLLYFLIPYLAMEFFSVCIGAMRGFFSLHLMKMAFVMMLFHLLLYLLLYFSIVLVISVTGHFMMGALLLAAVVVYGPALGVLLEIYEGVFYFTYSAGGSDTFTRILIQLGSPVMLADTFTNKYAQGNFGTALVLVVVFTVLFGILGYLAYVYRKSERTNQAFVYNCVGTLVRFLIVIPTGLGVGMIFYGLPTDDSKILWWIFGMILGTVLCGGIVESIYHMDFRKFFSHKLQFILNGAVVAILACVFFFDLTGYDSYIPSYEEIQNIAIGNSYLEWESYYNIEVKENNIVNSLEDDLGRRCNIGIDPHIYACMENILKECNDSNKELPAKNSVWDTSAWEEEGDALGIRVLYELKSGKKVYRYYPMTRESFKELIKTGYEYGTVKADKYAILQLDNKYSDQVYATFADGRSLYIFQENKAKREQLIDAFRQDVEEAAADVFVGKPCAVLTIEYPDVPEESTLNNMMPGENTSTRYLEGKYYVFPQFKRTVEILKETGYPVSMEEVNITSVETEYYMNEKKTESSSVIAYREPKQLEELKQVLRCIELVPIWEKPEYDKWTDINVWIDDKKSEALWVITSEEAPEFMNEDYQRAMAFEVFEEDDTK